MKDKKLLCFKPFYTRLMTPKCVSLANSGDTDAAFHHGIHCLSSEKENTIWK